MIIFSLIMHQEDWILFFSDAVQYFLQIWADEGDDDDWACVQTLGETNKYYVLASLYL